MCLCGRVERVREREKRERERERKKERVEIERERKKEREREREDGERPDGTEQCRALLFHRRLAIGVLKDALGGVRR